MYKFNPLTDAELEESSLVPDGEYKFIVTQSVYKVSQKGNQMAELQIAIEDSTGATRKIFDHLVFSDHPLNIKKIKRFCDSTGLEEQYKQGAIPVDLTNLEGIVRIGIQPEKQNPSGGFYAKKNIVIEYIKLSSGKLAANTEKEFIDDSFPF
jgi:hypothetical protein